MVKTYSVDEIITIGHRDICPECAEHEQVNIIEANALMREHECEVDCKNLFRDKHGEIEGQCMCYSRAHIVER